jgi:hypothetical protein
MSHPSIQILHDALNDLRDQHSNIASFCATWRAQDSLFSRLPPRYAEVAEDLLGRLEAGSLFTEESCSFSQEDLLNNLALLLHKAERTLT